MPESNGNGKPHKVRVTAEDSFRSKTRFNQAEMMLTMNELLRRRYATSGNGLKDPRRDIDDECGYPKSIEPEDYLEMYNRDAVASRVVEVLPKESWKTQPEVYEAEDEEKDTDFELAWRQLPDKLAGETNWFKDKETHPIWEMLRRLDEIAGIGHYGVLFLGIDDGKDASEPVEGIDPITGEFTGAGEPKYKLTETEGKDEYDISKESDVVKRAVAGQDKRPKPLVGNAPPPFVKKKKGAAPPSASPDQDVEDPEEDLEDTDEDLDETPLEGMQEGDVEDPEALTQGMGGEEEEEREIKTKRRLLYMRLFDESNADIAEFENDVNSPRFGRPKMYNLTFNDPKNVAQAGTGLHQATKKVHWTRVIHVADERGINEDFARPRLQQVYNRIYDLIKLYGGSAEMYWKGAFMGMSLETIPQLGADVMLDEESTRSQMENYFNGLQRYFALSGATAKPLGPQVADPTAQVKIQLEAICIKIACPMRVFLGSERGELASSQDDATWNDRIRDRQKYFITPKIIVPFFNRLIAIGVLPEPSKFSVDWPDLNNLSEPEQAAIALQKVDAITKFIAGSGETYMTPLDFFVRIMGMDPDEAEEVIESASSAAEAGERLTQDPTELQEQEMEMKQEQMDNDFELAKEGKLPAPIVGGGPPGIGGPPMPPGAGPPGKPGSFPKPVPGMKKPKPPALNRQDLEILRKIASRSRKAKHLAAMSTWRWPT